MDKTFETPGQVRLVVENGVGLVAITARATETREFTFEFLYRQGVTERHDATP